LSIEAPAIPEHGVIDFSLRDSDIESNSAEKAIERIERISRGVRLADTARTYYRWLLGRQLIAIRDNRLWVDIIAEKLEQARTFDDWLKFHLEPFTGLNRHSGYGAISIAESKAVNQLGEDGLRRCRSLVNVLMLAKVDRREPGRVTPELLDDVLKLSVKDFRNKVEGVRERGSVSANTDTPAQAKHLQLIISQLKSADSGALKALNGTIENIWPLCGNNPTDVLDFINAACMLSIEEARAGYVDDAKTYDIKWEEIEEELKSK